MREAIPQGGRVYRTQHGRVYRTQHGRVYHTQVVYIRVVYILGGVYPGGVYWVIPCLIGGLPGGRPFVYPIVVNSHPGSRKKSARKGIPLLTLLARKRRKETSTQGKPPLLSPGLCPDTLLRTSVVHRAR